MTQQKKMVDLNKVVALITKRQTELVEHIEGMTKRDPKSGLEWFYNGKLVGMTEILEMLEFELK